MKTTIKMPPRSRLRSRLVKTGPRRSTRPAWWLAQRAHVKRLCGERHVSWLADLWEDAAVALTRQDDEALLALSREDPVVGPLGYQG